MNVVDAASVGQEIREYILVKKHTRGSVIGAYRHGLYFQTGNNIFVIHSKEDGQVPFGVELSDFFSIFASYKDFLNCGVRISRDEISFENKPLTVRIKTESSIAGEARAELSAETLRLRADHILSFLGQSSKGWLASLLLGGEPVDDPGRRRVRAIAADGIKHLVESLDFGFEEDVCRALKSIIGLGVGLTPSMDDWLVGFTYTLPRISACRTEADILCRALMNVHREGGTGIISKAYLLGAAKGGYFELLDKCFYDGSQQSFEVLSGIGSSSGCDMLMGIYDAVDYSLNRIAAG